MYKKLKKNKENWLINQSKTKLLRNVGLNTRLFL